MAANGTKGTGPPKVPARAYYPVLGHATTIARVGARMSMSPRQAA